MPETRAKDRQATLTKDGQVVSQARSRDDGPIGKFSEHGDDEHKNKKVKTSNEQSEQNDTAPIAEPRCLEKGQILFLAQPKVEQDHIEGLDDVAKFHVLLLPDNLDPTTSMTSSVPSAKNTDGVVSEEAPKNEQKFFRLIEIGKKRLPANEGHEIFWAAVSLVGSDLTALKSTLGPSTYETKTRGTRHVAESDIVGAGAYQFYCPGGEKDWKTYLVYALSIPETPAPVQGEFEIGKSGSMIVQVKDPRTPAAGPGQGFPSSRRVTYPESLLNLFEQKNIAANPTSLLDYAAAELLLIGAGSNVEQKLGKDAKKLEKESDEVVEALTETGDPPEAIMDELHLSAKDINVDGLKGHWTNQS